MKRIVLVVSIVVSLVLGLPEYYLLGSEESIESSLDKKHLDNLNLLVNLSRAGKSTLKAAAADPKYYQEKALTGRITARAETYHAIIYAYESVIPDFLINNFDRIYRMIVSYFNLKDINDKIVIWVMDFETLRRIPFGPESCFKGCPRTLAALYVPIFNYVLLTPQYMDDYYVVHELLHYFTDEYEKEVIAGLPEIIKQQNLRSLPLKDFLKQNQERIAAELSKTIIRWSEESLL